MLPLLKTLDLPQGNILQMLSTLLYMQTPTVTLRNCKYVKCRGNLRSRNIYNLSPFSRKNEMAKFEKNMNKSGIFLTISKDDCNYHSDYFAIPITGM